MKLTDFCEVISCKTSGKRKRNLYKVFDVKILNKYFENSNRVPKTFAENLGISYESGRSILTRFGLWDKSKYQTGELKRSPNLLNKTKVTKHLEKICLDKIHIAKYKYTKYKIKCSTAGCGKVFWTKSRKDQKYKCLSCVKTGKPYSAAYKRILQNDRNIPVTLTYEEYVKLTEIKDCEYCSIRIPWEKIKDNCKNGRKGHAYYVDRKNSKLGYTKENSVVCCSSCNRMKSNEFSHLEFIQIGKKIAEVLQQRKRSGN